MLIKTKYFLIEVASSIQFITSSIQFITNYFKFKNPVISRSSQFLTSPTDDITDGNITILSKKYPEFVNKTHECYSSSNFILSISKQAPSETIHIRQCFIINSSLVSSANLFLGIERFEKNLVSGTGKTQKSQI